MQAMHSVIFFFHNVPKTRGKYIFHMSEMSFENIHGPMHPETLKWLGNSSQLLEAVHASRNAVCGTESRLCVWFSVTRYTSVCDVTE